MLWIKRFLFFWIKVLTKYKYQDRDYIYQHWYNLPCAALEEHLCNHKNVEGWKGLLRPLSIVEKIDQIDPLSIVEKIPNKEK